MVAVKEITWEEAMSPDFGNPARIAWREAVAEIAAKAHDKLPECNGRVDSAVTMVLAGDVELLPDGTARVASQSNGQTVYHVVNGHCDCRDYEKAPHHFCKHRLSAAIARRAQELVKARVDAATPVSQPTQPPAPTTPLPEAPASVNVHLELAGRQVQLTLRDSDEGRLLARLEAVLQRFPLVVKPTDTPAQREGWCSKHGVQMRQNHKDGRSWWSHKTADGWCKGK
ncbi:MAG: hypothetical protein FJZ47_07170 [Candidatus Tectomicrobia bacterium]|uniref:SWIM-type domain-containing protein n=1 Tax=Tectimicrobiota bacterium TaxID=2528274 RepID=A0A937W0M4_UNCTE|nr:hypothetical protein [Candidatus Tectomicrobia bacterium]